ncbi:MAG: GFA family protein [Burkholderiales bacterium]|nr:GFA family protein [Burkholderiales bacterium]
MSDVLTGGCHCGAIRYEVSGQPVYTALCHCTDCRRSAGAPMVAWGAYPEGSFALLRGEPRTFNSSGTSYRSFCADCGSGLYFRNEQVLPGLVDIQIATLDDPDRLPPQIHVQTAERLHWIAHGGELPEFDRYPQP